MIEGIDVSKFQSSIDWPKARATGREFVFMRASDGTNPANETTLASKWAAARAAGFVCGAYHFFRPSADLAAVQSQASLFLGRFNEAVPVVETGYLPAVVDVEVSPGAVSKADYARGVRTWIDAIEASPRFQGLSTIIYTRASLWSELGNPPEFATHPLWVADYSQDPPRLPAPWGRWTFFQYSESSTVDGIAGHVDADRFDGSRADLLALTDRRG